jgi:hypothetical protein
MGQSDPRRSTNRSNEFLRLAVSQILGAMLVAAGSAAQAPQVKTWTNGTEGMRTQITIAAQESIRPTPVLLLECTHEPKKRPAIGIYLIAGPLKPHPRVGLLNSVSEWLLPIHFDGGKAVFLSWTPTGQPGTYAYEGDGRNGMASECVSAKKLLEDLLAAKVFAVELQKKGESASREAIFDTSQLRKAFDVHCEGMVE